MTYRHSDDNQFNQFQYSSEQKFRELESQVSTLSTPNIRDVAVDTSTVTISVPAGTQGAAIIGSDAVVSVAITVTGSTMSIEASGPANLRLMLV